MSVLSVSWFDRQSRSLRPSHLQAQFATPRRLLAFEWSALIPNCHTHSGNSDSMLTKMASTTFSIGHALELGEKEIFRIWKLIEDEIGPPHLEAECTDDVARQFSSLQDLLEYQNDASRAVTRLTIRATSLGSSRGPDCLTAVLQVGLSWSTARCAIEAPETILLRTRASIEETLHEAKPWYAPFAGKQGFVGQLVLWIIALILLAGSTFRLPIIATAIAAASPLTLVIAGAVVGAMLAAPLNKVRESLFPSVTYLLGNGTKRNHLREKIRWGVLVAFVVSAIASILVGAAS